MSESKLSQLLSYAPLHYQRSELYRSLMQAAAEEAQGLDAAMQDVFAQFFVETATWGLGYWEAELGIITNESLSWAVRRTAVLQMLRGTGTLTSEKLSRILDIYGARMAVIESDYAAYHFDAVLVDFILSPRRPVDDVSATIRDTIAAVRPAHLGFQVQYREYVAESFREWFKQQTGQDFAASDELGMTASHTFAEEKFGLVQKWKFRTNASLDGAVLGPDYTVQDTGRFVFERADQRESYPLPDSAVSGVRELTAAREETVQPNEEQRSGLELTAANEELHVMQGNEPGAFRFNLQPLNAAPLLHVPVCHVASSIGTRAIAEARVLQSNEPQALRMNARRLNRSPLLSVPVPSVSAGVLYRRAADGTETMLEQRTL